jgi:hypothetical protein
MQATMAKVGLDVHAEQTQAAVFDPLTGELSFRRLNAPPLAVLDFLAGLEAGACAVYEAGPSGFALARAAAERGLDVRVVAPGLIPRKAPTASRPTGAMRPGWRACSPPASSASCASPPRPRSASATSSAHARTCAAT